MAKKRVNYSKRIAAVLLSGLMSFGSMSPAYAEETAAPDTTETTTETSQPSAEATATATADAPKAEESAPAETAAPTPSASAEATAAPTASASASASPAPTAKASVIPAPSASPTATASVKADDADKVEVDASNSSVYSAKDIVDYVAALSTVRSTADNKLIVHSFDDISDSIQNGKGLYFDGAYIIVFDDAADMEASKKAITAKLGEVVFDDEAMTVDTDDNNSNGTASAEPQGEITADADTAKDAEQVATVVEEKANDDAVKTVALIDSGVNDGYADVSINLTTESGEDTNGHGTKMAQIIKGGADNKVSIISIKAFNSDGSASIATVAAAVKYARLLGVDIINISASVPDSDNTEPLKQEVKDAVDAGIKVVASAGNDADDAGKYVPANVDGVDTVGAAESVDDFSAFKATATSNIGDCVNFYYIADSTSEAAAMESAVLAAGKEDMEYAKSGIWMRFREVADRDTPKDDTIMSHAVSVDKLEEEQGFLTYEQRESLNRVHLNGGHYTPWVHSPTADGGVLASERYQMEDGTWDLSASNFYYYAPGTYHDGAKATAQLYCQDHDIKAWPEDGKYNCSVNFGTLQVQGNAYDGRVIPHNISFNNASIGSYDPATHNSEATAYVFTDSNGNLADGGYSAPTVSVGNGDSSKVHVKVNGNSLLVWFDADWDADMPDDITVTISGGKQKAATPHKVVQQGSASSSVHCEASGHFQRLWGDSAGTPQIVEPGEDGYSYNPASIHLNVLRGSYKVNKVDIDRGAAVPQGDATLAGAVFTLYRASSKDPVATATTAEDGTATFENLKWGDYSYAETTAPEGYELNSESVSFTIDTQGVVVNENGAVKNKDKVIIHIPNLKKVDADTGKSAAEGDAKLGGTTYDIYNVSKHAIFYNNTWIETQGIKTDKSVTVTEGRLTGTFQYGKGNYIKTITTDETGEVSLGDLPYGSYLAVETKAPEGYLMENPDRNGEAYTHGVFAVAAAVHAADTTLDGLKDDVQRGQLIVGKVDLERMQSASGKDANVPQGDASLAGAEFTIYLRAGNSVVVDGTEYNVGDAVKVITSDENGIAKTPSFSLPYGSYTVKETKAPEGYKLNDTWGIDFEIRSEGEVKNFAEDGKFDDRVGDQVYRGGISITKTDVDRYIKDSTKANRPQGDASLEGAEYTIYNISKEDMQVLSGGLTANKTAWVDTTAASISDRASIQAITADDSHAVWTLVTDKTGFATTEANSLPYGTYLIKETKAPEGYLLNDYWYSIIEIREDGKVYDAVADNTKKADQVYSGAAVDEVIRGGVKFQKIDAERDQANAQGDATLEGAEITIYNISKADVYGASLQDSANSPTYTGENSNGSTDQFHWVDNGDAPTAVDANIDVLHKLNGTAGDVPTVVADNAKSGMTDADGKYAYITNNGFADSTDTAYDDALKVDATQSSKSDTRSFANAQPVVTIKTNAAGIASTGNEALPYGTYVAVETKPSRGYNLNAHWIVTFEIREDGVIVDLTDAEHQLAEEVIRGDVRIYKEDLEMSELNGVDRANYGYKDSNKTSDSTGTGSDSSYGDDTVKTDVTETSGYKIGSESAHHAGVIDGKKGELAENAENNPSQAIGGKKHSSTIATLSGIEFTITNKSTLSVLSDAGTLKEYQPGEFVTTITTHYDAELDTDGDGVADSAGYVAETTGKALPYGTYVIQETKTNDAYMLTDGTPRTFEIEYDGEIADTSKLTHHSADAGEELIFRNQIRRGDFDFVKIAAHTSDRIQSLWVLENDTSGEKHVLVTDKNGEFKSYEFSHSDNTNNNDALLDTIGTDYEKMIDLTGGIADGSIKEYAGVWFGMGEDGSMAKVNDRLGALPYGQYTLHEVRTNTNDGKELQDVTFYITKNSTFNASGIIEKDSAVHLGTITDEGPSIKTTASADDSGSNVGTAGETKAILDAVTYRDLDAGTYTLKTSLVNADTGAVLKDADGNDLVKEEEVTVTSTKGKFDVKFDVDTTNFGGLNVVVFEELYKADENGELVRIAGHVDRLDSKQTVAFPGIRTTLADTTKTQPKAETGMYYLTDTVKYNGLDVGKTYKLTGTLHLKNADGTDAGELKDADGNVVTATSEFKAKSESGTATVVFTVPRELLAGQTVVAFETVSQGEKTIAVHADITDEDQTIPFSKIPVIHTTATNKDSDLPRYIIGDPLTITDTVSYQNLTVGKTYTLYGDVHVRTYTTDDSGNRVAVDGGTLKNADGSDVSAVATFTADTENGTQGVEFAIDGSLLNGQELVVFEKLYEGESATGDVVAEHSDITDRGQSITTNNTMIRLQTTASGKNVISGGGKTAEINDVVSYRGLIVGGTYHLVGTLHIKNADGTDGGVLKDAAGNPVVATTDFTADRSAGTAEVNFSFSTSLLKDASAVVVFEDLYQTSQIDENGNVRTGESPISSHGEIGDADQTVDVLTPGEVKISTTASGTGLIALDGKTTEITDVVKYSGLEVGTAYHMVGTLHIKNADGTDGGVLKSAVGSVVTASADFTPTADSGTVDVKFSFPSSLLKGVDNLVVFEDLYTAAQVENGTVKTGEKPVVSHADITDTDQTVEISGSPAIKTTAVNKATNGKTVVRGDSVTIVDTVAYTGLVPGQRYKLVGELHTDVDKVLAIGGKPLSEEVIFTPKEADGTVDVTFKAFSTKTLEIGQRIVAFETLTPIDGEGRSVTDSNGTKQLVHEDMNDDGQTVSVVTVEAKIHTAAQTKEGKQTVVQGDKVKITDTVEFKGLVVGQRYRVTGEIHTSDKVALASNGKKIEQSVTFVARSSDGSVDVVFDEFSTEALKAGTKLVVFETLIPIDENGNRMIDDHGTSVLEHKDMNDKDQTITVTAKPGPEIHTNAVFKDTNAKNMKVDTKTGAVTINDTVTYQNLVPGTKYVLYGTLMDKATGNAISATSALEFTPNQANGSIVVPIQVDGSKLIGKTGVVFEELRLKDTGETVAEHKDINDAAQTVVFGDTSFTATDAGRGVMIAGIAAVAACVVLVIIKRKKKAAE